MSGCARFSDLELSDWLAVEELREPMVLAIAGADLYDSHTAIRHAHDLLHKGGEVTILVPEELRRNRAFTPWLATAQGTPPKTVTVNWERHSPKEQSCCVLLMKKQSSHVHAAGAAHYASFDLRVAGRMTRVLLDTGATCSCLAAPFVERLGRSWKPLDSADGGISGIGGRTVALGSIDLPVKVGKNAWNQEFLVVKEPVAGYDCLLGEDFLAAHDCGVFYSAGKVHLSIGSGPKNNGNIIHSRQLAGGHAVKLQRETHFGAVAVPSRVEFAEGSRAEERTPASHRQRRKLLQKVAAGKAVAYRLVLSPKQTVAAVQPDASIPVEIQAVLNKHSQEGGTLCGKIPDNTHAKGFECRIELLPGARPVNLRQYRLTPREKEELLVQCDSFIKKGWIEPSASGWSSSVLFVPKPGNKLRFCVDFRGLNQRTVVDPDNKHVIPRQVELMDSLKGAAVFSTLDLASGYYQLAMEPNSRPLTAFPTPYGLYQWRVMPMGLMNAPAIFQRAMNTILREHIRAGYCLVYLDDIIVLSRSIEEHAKHLEAVLSALAAHRLFCQLPKCTWAKPELKYLGHIVSGAGVKPDPTKVAALDNWDPPLADVEILRDAVATATMKAAAKKRVVHECRRYLGFMNYFNRFIPRYSDQAAVLHDQTKDDGPEWSEHCAASWHALKQCLRNATLMFHPDADRPFHVFSDASIRAIGGVLMQESEGQLVPIAFCARKLAPAEVNYSTTEQELLAIVYCFGQWRCYLEGPKVLLHTDHEPLTWLAGQKLPNRRQARWLEFMSRFEYEILYVKGDKNVVADALSRRLEPPVGVPDEMLSDAWPEAALILQRGNGSAPRAAPGIRARPPPDDVAVSEAPHTAGIGRVAPALGGVAAVGSPARRYGGGGTLHVLAVCRYAAVGGYTRARAARFNDGGPSAARGSGGAALPRPQHFGRHKGQSANAPHLPTDVSGNARSGVQRSKQGSVAEDAPLTDFDQAQADDAPLEPVLGRRERLTGSGSLAPSRSEFTESAELSSVSHSQPPPTDVPDQPLSVESGGPDGDPAGSHSELDPSLSDYERLFEDLFTRVRKALVTDPAVSTAYKRAGLKLVERHGLLWRHGKQLYVPLDAQLRQDILYWHHDVPWCAHLGMAKTMELVKRQFYWPAMDKDIRNYIASCYKCQANKPDRRPAQVPLTPLIPPDACWRVLGVDLIVDLPESAGDGFNAICVFACHLSKMVRIIPTRTTLDSPGFAKLFIREVFPHYGMPRAIVSDRGPQWNSEFFRALCERMNIRLQLSTAYHPQTNGLVERFNEVISAALRHFVAADQRDWDEKLPFIEYAMNSAYDQSTQSTPFRMNRITLPLNPFDAVVRGPGEQARVTSPLASWMGSSSASPLAAGCRTVVEAQESFAWARQCVHRAKEVMKERHDARSTRNHLYSVGQLVWFNQRHIRLRHPTRRLKLQPRFVGPVRVVEVVGRSAVRLDLPARLDIHPTVSVTLVKPFVARQGVALPPVIIDGELEWEVEAVVDHNLLVSRKRAGASYLEFRVRWKGSFEDSWHEFTDFENAVDSVQKYISACPKSVRTQILKALKPAEVSVLNAQLQTEAMAARAQGTRRD